MTLRIRYIIAILTLLAIITGCSKSPEDKLIELEKDKIKAVFSNFQNALTKHESTNIKEYLTKESLDEFGEYKDIALHASEDNMQSLSLMKKLYVLSLRHLLTEKKLLGMDKTDILPFLMDNKITLNGAAILYFELSHIAVKDDAANAWFKFKDEQFSDYSFLFLKQDGTWKFDLRTMLRVSEGAVATLIKKQNIPENDALILSIETATGRKVSPNIWRPLKS